MNACVHRAGWKRDRYPAVHTDDFIVSFRAHHVAGQILKYEVCRIQPSVSQRPVSLERRSQIDARLRPLNGLSREASRECEGSNVVNPYGRISVSRADLESHAASRRISLPEVAVYIAEGARDCPGAADDLSIRARYESPISEGGSAGDSKVAANKRQRMGNIVVVIGKS